MQANATMYIARDGYGATQRAVVSSKDSAGAYQLSIRAVCACGAHAKQAYTLVWTGDVAKLWYEGAHQHLTPGQPIKVWWLNQLAINGTIMATVDFLTLAPTAQQAAAAKKEPAHA